MVLQRERPISIWGYAAAGETVTVAFKKQKKTAVADASGRWSAELAPLTASAEPADMLIAGKDSSIQLHDILVGEVWLCSGQSNMEFSMRKNSKFEKALHGNGPENELEKANNPLIRIFLVRTDYSKPHPLRHRWDTAAGEPLRDFSAAGYFFAKELYAQLKVPIGVISAAVPGSRIEPWMPPAPVAADDSSHPDPGKFYASMISPLAPFTLRGFLWYQGESNCFLNDTVAYTGRMRTLIESWRSLWRGNELPFYYVQIAPFRYSQSKDGRPHGEQTLAEFRRAQYRALAVPKTGMIVITDLVDKLDDIHPAYKWEVGRRLALLALARDYKVKTESSGPVFQRMETKGAQAMLYFSHTGSGLTSNDGQPLSWFTIAGANGVFVPAQAVIKNNTVIVSAPEVSKPAAVRFAWNEAAQPNFFNKDGLPAAPFDTAEPVIKDQ
ncbi:MAG: sialate O-acetylesterase [Bacteroidetes bacterium]|nr:sialate O-acetylesterase [Bacteroidota bacterium]